MVKSTAPKITRKKVTDYLPDDHNANQGTERGLQMIEDSLHQDGVGRSIVADAHGRVPAGNKTLEAAMNAGITEVIEIETDGNALIVHKRSDWDLADPKGAARRYAYRDNRAAEVGLSWDANVIAADIEAGLDLGSMFQDYEISALYDQAAAIAEQEQRQLNYSRKIEVPLYEPSGEKPDLSALYDNRKTQQLIADINAAPIPQAEKHFLIAAAHRHTVLNFAAVADWYAHSEPHVQRLMEASALVILDFDRALELGYVKLTKHISDLIAATDYDAEDEADDDAP